MKKVYSPRALNKAIKGINIPAAEDILPAGALEKNESKKALITPIIFKRYGIAAAAAVLVITLSIPAVIHILDTPPVTDTPSADTPSADTPSTDTPSTDMPAVDIPDYSGWPVIYSGGVGDFFGNEFNAITENNGVLTSQGRAVIYPELKKKMTEYDGQNVLFRVIIEFSINEIDREPTEKYAKQLKDIQKEIDELKVEASELFEKYNESATAEEKNRFYREWKSALILADAAERRKDELLRKDAAEYRASVIKDELEFMKNSGGLHISQFSSTAEIKPKNPLYIANLNAETINEMVARGNCNFYLYGEYKEGPYVVNEKTYNN